MKFGYIPVASEFLDENELNNIVSAYASQLEKIGGIRLQQDKLDSALPLFYFAITGGTESSILLLHEKRKEFFNNSPALLLAHPANNSLPASLEVLAKLQQDNHPGRIFFLKSADDDESYSTIAETLNDIEIYDALCKTRIGVIGSPSEWLVASMPDAETVKQSWGMDIVNIDFEQLNSALAGVEKDSMESGKFDFQEDALEIVEPVQKDIDDAAKVYAALKQVIEKNNVDAVTVRCFDLVKGMKTTGCFGLARLTDEGIIAGCEGDLVSTIAMLWANKLLNQVPWMANPAQIDVKENSLWLAHCNVPLTLVQDYKLRSHFESGLGVGIQGSLPKGPVTLIRIGGKEMEKLWLAEGNIVAFGNSENLCRTQAKIEFNKEGSANELLLSPLGNHIVVVYGHHIERLTTWRNNIKNIFG